MKQLRKSDIKEINYMLEEKYGLSSYYNPKSKLVLKEGDLRTLSSDSPAQFFDRQGVWIPTVRTLLQNLFLKKVTVDMGAVKFVVNGADIMRPGVTACDDGIAKDEPVAIVDENHGKPLGVGLALFSSEGIMAQKSGKVVKSLHYVGDELWN